MKHTLCMVTICISNKLTQLQHDIPNLLFGKKWFLRLLEIAAFLQPFLFIESSIVHVLGYQKDDLELVLSKREQHFRDMCLLDNAHANTSEHHLKENLVLE